MGFTKIGPTGLAIVGQEWPTSRSFPHTPFPSFYPSSASFRRAGLLSPSPATRGSRLRSVRRVKGMADEVFGLSSTAQTTSNGVPERHREAKPGLLTRFTTEEGSEAKTAEEGFIKVDLRSYKLSDLSAAERNALQARPRIDFSSIFDIVGPIVNKVRTEGDEAVKEYTSRFDKVQLEKTVEAVADLPEPQLDPEVKAAFDVAYENIRTFHAAQQKTHALQVETMPGVTCRRVARAINSVGLYVPGGTAVLPSTALMLAVPAQIAGCKTVVVATPPRPDGSICPEVLYCAKKAGATHILKAGGAQAVAAMAWGTKSCPKVDKILGPGNQYVTAAKMLLQGKTVGAKRVRKVYVTVDSSDSVDFAVKIDGLLLNSEAMVSIDMPAGPSEVLVIADEHASPVHVAADLLSQAEHGPDSQVVLVAVGDSVDVRAISSEVERQCNALPRGDIASKALLNSFTLIAANKDEACAFSNLYAPEHLIVNVEEPESWLASIDNAGSVFLGKWTPESVGDYASGTNHVLPTYGYARMYGGVSLDSFVKYMTVQSLSSEGLMGLGPSVAKMAEVEGLEAHARAVTLRLQDLRA